MGEVTELVLKGILCCQCGSFISDKEAGYPRLCDGCHGDFFMIKGIQYMRIK